MYAVTIPRSHLRVSLVVVELLLERLIPRRHLLHQLLERLSSTVQNHFVVGKFLHSKTDQIKSFHTLQ